MDNEHRLKCHLNLHFHDVDVMCTRFLKFSIHEADTFRKGRTRTLISFYPYVIANIFIDVQSNIRSTFFDANAFFVLINLHYTYYVPYHDAFLDFLQYHLRLNLTFMLLDR